MIDTFLKLWPVVAGTGGAAWIVFQFVYKRWTRKRDVQAARKAKADAIAESAVETARAQAAAAIADHMHTLEQTITDQAAQLIRMQDALDVSHASEVEAWRRANGQKGNR